LENQPGIRAQPRLQAKALGGLHARCRNQHLGMIPQRLYNGICQR
jgi:hypothetical protein